MTRKIGGSAVHLWGRVGECMHGRRRSGVGVVGVNGYKLKQGGSTPTHLANNLSTGPPLLFRPETFHKSLQIHFASRLGSNSINALKRDECFNKLAALEIRGS